MFKNIYDVRSLCKAVKIHHSVYYYHKQNKENSYKKANEELDKRIEEEYENLKKDMFTKNNKNTEQTRNKSKSKKSSQENESIRIKKYNSKKI